ncbi:hypothetical protein G6F37_003101 [Rhizopus arrhizus]|nr:hypothetical protein G6F38_002746 [Rhizopus arrhizus]KAG1161407.1 hypothetical protein G6F37_003101 [Rhizopus arrhizus]
MSSNSKPSRTKVPPISTREEISGQDKAVLDTVLAPSQYIDAIILNVIIRDLDYIIQYIGQRIILEEKYLADLVQLTNDAQAIPNKDNAIGIQKCFLSYVDLTDEYKPFREQYLQRLKKQLEELKEFRASCSEQQKMYDKNKYWMHQTNQEYLLNRLKKLPKAQQTYQQKWEEIEKSTGMAITTPMLATPSTTTATSFPLLKREISQEETVSPNESDTSPSSLPTQQSRIERFMKKHLNKPEDPTRHNIRIAKLKVEVAEADTNYRNIVREISTLAIKMDATNQHIMKQVQNVLKEKSNKIKDILTIALKADIEQLQKAQKPLSSMLEIIENTDAQLETDKYASMSILQKYPKPEPVYYKNHHVGECKDLIFGTSLTEYAQQRGRSPPLLITKCIEAIERLDGLEKEGIYRVSGKQSNMEKIKHAFERDEEAVVIGQNDVPEDIFSIASVIKIFLRELKTPLFPFKLDERLIYSQIPDQELRLMNLLTRLLKLPPANYDTLKALVAHLSRIQSFVEKNKMTVSNLTLIFTPAIFQDLNHAQNAVGEWAKDCVLEDLILNNNDIFANKDLHNNSAITGDIEYGFSQNDVHSSSNDRYAMTITSPDSPTEIDYASMAHANEGDYILSLDEYENDHAQENKLPERTSSISHNTTTKAPPMKLSKSTPTERNYRAQFQGKGLKVDTSINPRHHQNSIMAVKSATVPSYDWASQNPENSPIPDVPKLKRSATTGKKNKNFNLDPEAAAAFNQLKIQR